MYETPEGLQFHRCEEAAVTGAVRHAESTPFQSVGTDRKVHLVCFHQCVGEERFQNPGYYLRPGATHKLCPEWEHAAKASKWPPFSKKVRRAMANLQEKSHRINEMIQYASPQEVVDTMQSKAFKKGMDWVNHLVPHLHLLYGCVACDSTTIESFSLIWRAIREYNTWSDLAFTHSSRLLGCDLRNVIVALSLARLPQVLVKAHGTALAAAWHVAPADDVVHVDSWFCLPNRLEMNTSHQACGSRSHRGSLSSSGG